MMAYKDANEHLQHDRESFIAAANALESAAIKASEAEAQEALINYQQKSAGARMLDFTERIFKTPHGISTGFANVDKELDGGLHEGLYFIGAISSLGKTTFCLQIADQIAAAGNDVLFFTLEQSEFELMAKSISRITYQNCGEKAYNAKTARGIAIGHRYGKYNEDELALITDSTAEYQRRTENRLYFVEGVGDIGVENGRQQIKAIVEEHIKITGRKPVVVIDYLQILAPADSKASDKQNTDRAVNALKRLSRDHGLVIIGVSSFNRDNYNSPVNMASFKESGAIEYSSDVLLALQPADMASKEDGRAAVEECKASPIREVELVILKNRNGKTGGKVKFEFYSQFNLFTEIQQAKAAIGKIKVDKIV